MKTFHLRREQHLERPLEELFPFFSDPGNLALITPPSLGFQVLSATTDTVQEGTEIDYSLRVRGLPVRWRSRIVQWDPPYGFTDIQLRGPYRLWHHQHHFEERDGITISKDHVEYAMIGGALIDKLLVRPDLERIFDYRSEQLARLFGEVPAGASLEMAAT
jgi:ligand-binding SRPBCC domain-containing protein